MTADFFARCEIFRRLICSKNPDRVFERAENNEISLFNMKLELFGYTSSGDYIFECKTEEATNVAMKTDTLDGHIFFRYDLESSKSKFRSQP